MSKAWGGLGGAGAWALDAERAEEEEREAAVSFPAPDAPAAAGGAASFPSLREAAASAGAGKSKKKKGTTLSLSEFTTYGAGGAPGRRAAPPAGPKGLTPQEMMMLPTGPRERSAEELERSRLGGGFRSYGSGFGASGERREGGFDDDGRRGGRGSDLDMPSRADEDGNWALNKKSFSPSPAESGPRNRYGSLGGGSDAPVGRADDDGDWSRGKKPLPSRYPSLGSGGGFRDTPGSTDNDRWSRATPHNGERERPRLVLDPPKRESSTTPAPPAADAGAGRSRPSPFGAARPREDVLAEKGLDPRKMEAQIDEKKTSRPTSSQSSRPGSAHSSRPGSPGSQVSAAGSEGAARARPKVNPFGNAKPREMVLQEKGKDWRKIDLELEHRRIDRPETNEERDLKEEINLLKIDLKESEDPKNLSEKISQMERDLELLTVELDDKVRFGQRPGSGAGRVTAPPPTNLAEGYEGTESTERPRSRGTIEQHPKPMEQRWGFQGSRDRGSFGGNRSSDRSSTGQRW